jgi:hypothetical protein
MLKPKLMAVFLGSILVGQVSALDLKSAKTPVHYECKHVLAGGIWQDEKTGGFKSGAVQPAPNDKFQLVLEKYDSTKGPRLKRCDWERRDTGRLRIREREFCVTKILQGRTGMFEDTHYCEITSESALANTNHALQCYAARIYLDTDRLFGVSIDSLDGIALNLPFPTTVNKFDCQRLDR